MKQRRNLFPGLSSCDFVSDLGCSDLTCLQCHAPKEGEICKTFARSAPSRKEWDASIYASKNCDSADYVDGWNDALDAVEQQTVVTARPEVSKAIVARAVLEVKHAALICTLAGCLIAACVGVILILLDVPGIVAALSTYAAGVGGGWLVTLRRVGGNGCRKHV